MHLSIARLFELYAESYAATEYPDLAIANFQAMKMQPALERALRHRGLLKA